MVRTFKVLIILLGGRWELHPPREWWLAAEEEAEVSFSSSSFPYGLHHLRLHLAWLHCL